MDKVMRRWQRANDPTATDEELLQLAEDEDWWVRKAVWENPSAPDEARRRLEADNFKSRPETVLEPPRYVSFGVLGPWWTIATAVAVGVTLGALAVWLLFAAVLKKSLGL